MKTDVSQIGIFIFSFNLMLLFSAVISAQDASLKADMVDEVTDGNTTITVSDTGESPATAGQRTEINGTDAASETTDTMAISAATEADSDATSVASPSGTPLGTGEEAGDGAAAVTVKVTGKSSATVDGAGADKASGKSLSRADTASDETDDARPGFFRKLAKKSKSTVKARVFGYYKFSDQAGDHNQFKLDVARINFSYSSGRTLEAVLEYDFSNLVDEDDVKDGLRDAYVRLEPIRAFGIQLGQFKKPFSRLELMSRKRLPTITRGESNEYALEFLHYGGRDIGAMVSGRLIKKIKLDYYAGIFNGAGTDNVDLGSNSLDYAFRVESKPVKWLDVGVAASIHNVREDDYSEFFDPYAYENLTDDDFPVWLNNTMIPNYGEYAMARFADAYPWLSGKQWLIEMDTGLKLGDFEASLETMLGENWWFKDAPYLWSVTGLLSYKFPFFGGAMAVEPALFAEMLYIEDRDWTWRVRMMQLTPGVNVHFGDNVRLMIHGQLVRTTGVEADIDEAPLAGFWPGEWPGSFSGYKNLFIQLAFAN
ncbi:MAG: hypothetical protein JXX14_23195 [Deltaproteobacteria bacterium]|nr:hypothetical protein [Deltaproteobacteria bacterium]